MNVAHDDVLDIDRESLLARGLLVVSRARLDRRVLHKIIDDIPSLHKPALHGLRELHVPEQSPLAVA